MARIQLNELGYLMGVRDVPRLADAADSFFVSYSTGERDGLRGTFPNSLDAPLLAEGERSFIARFSRVLRVTTHFIVDDATGLLEVSRRIRNIFPPTDPAFLWIHKITMQVDPRYLGEMPLGEMPKIPVSLNRNSPPASIPPPDHQSDHCDPDLGPCPPPSLVAAPSGIRIEGRTSETSVGSHLVYDWSKAPLPIRLRPGRELLVRLTYSLR